MSIKSLRNKFLAFAVAGAFMIAQPEFARSEEPLIRGFYIQLEGRYVMSDGDEFPYAVSSDRQIFDIGMNEGAQSNRFGMGLHIGDNWDIGLHYSGLHIQGKRAGKDCLPSPAPTVPITNTAFGSVYPACFGALIAYPKYYPLIPYASVSAHSIETAAYDTTYHVIDFEVGYSLKLGQVDVRAFLGARYADFDQSVSFAKNYILSYDNLSPGVLFPIKIHADFQRDVLINGVGPRLGIEANVPLGTGTGFGLAGSVSGSVLFGERDTKESALGGEVSFSGSRRVPDGGKGNTFYNAEGDLGITYGVELGNASSMMMTIGYRAEAWFNVNNTRGTAPSDGTFGFPVGRVFGDVEAGQLFHGPFLRAKLNF